MRNTLIQIFFSLSYMRTRMILLILTTPSDKLILTNKFDQGRNRINLNIFNW